jgi:high-affinity K+ transport system ATPase subunit B
MEFTSIIGLLAGCGALAFLAFWWSSRSGSKSKGKGIVHGLKQALGQKEVELIEEKQKVVAVNIREKEKLSGESVKKIKEIQKKATEEIEDILHEDSIAKIADEIDKDWEDL